MSILDEIEAHIKTGRLVMVQPLNEIRAYQAPDERRALYVSPGIYRFLKSDRPLAAETEADFDDIVLGKSFEVGLELDHEYCLMTRLDPPSEEVWEIRIYDTRPQIRFFGRFAGRNIFVALVGPIRRSKAKFNWNRIKRQCVQEWRNLFTYAPVTKGDDIDAYLSNVNIV
jgi:hypothetical protein